MYHVTFYKNIYDTLIMSRIILIGYYAFPNQSLSDDPNLHYIYIQIYTLQIYSVRLTELSCDCPHTLHYGTR